jgi:hypothetical protein
MIAWRPAAAAMDQERFEVRPLIVGHQSANQGCPPQRAALNQFAILASIGLSTRPSTTKLMSFSAKRCACCPRPSFSSQSTSRLRMCRSPRTSMRWPRTDRTRRSRAEWTQRKATKRRTAVHASSGQCRPKRNSSAIVA